jgi:hypothetical protein
MTAEKREKKGESMRLLKVLALAAVAATTAVAAAHADPGRNIEAVLRPTATGPQEGFGLIRFRQPKDAELVVELDVWVRDLLPNHTYVVQRAAEGPANGECTGSNWTMPTLGTITTDDRGTGRAALSRPLPAALLGAEVDIHFRIAESADAASGVLASGCYQFVASL